MSLRSTYFRISREARNSKVDQLLALQLEAAENVDRNAGFLQKQKHDLPPVRPSFCHACLAPHTPCRICRNKLRDCFDLMMLIRYCLSAALEPTVSFPAAMRRRHLSSSRIRGRSRPWATLSLGFLRRRRRTTGRRLALFSRLAARPPHASASLPSPPRAVLNPLRTISFECVDSTCGAEAPTGRDRHS